MSLDYLSATELGRRFRAGSLSPVEAAEAALARIERLDPRLGAFVTVTAELAREQARRAAAELAAGKDRGPLHGVPVALKDVIDTAGVRTTFGARPFAQRVPERDATVVTRLRDAGAVLVGKLACIELAGALGCSSAASSLTGPTRNPWDRARWAGGSSSGAGAAVAAGLVPLALGTETLGSILCPAAFCGVLGHRPTYGLVSRRGVMPFSHTMDKVGVLARAPEDVAAALGVLAGRDPADPSSVAPPRRIDRLDAASIRGLRVAVLEQELGYDVHPSIGVYFEEALRALERAGAKLATVRLPDLPYSEVAEVITTAEAADVFDELIRSGRVRDLHDPRHATEDDYSGGASAVDYVRAMRVRSVVGGAVAEVLASHDVIATLNSPILPPLVDAPLPMEGGDLMRLAGNLCGLPALAVPMGFTPPGRLPTSFQLAARPFEDARLLSVAAAYQAVTDWHRARPPEA